MGLDRLYVRQHIAYLVVPCMSSVRHVCLCCHQKRCYCSWQLCECCTPVPAMCSPSACTQQCISTDFRVTSWRFVFCSFVARFSTVWKFTPGWIAFIQYLTCNLLHTQVSLTACLGDLRSEVEWNMNSTCSEESRSAARIPSTSYTGRDAQQTHRLLHHYWQGLREPFTGVANAKSWLRGLLCVELPYEQETLHSILMLVNIQ